MAFAPAPSVHEMNEIREIHEIQIARLEPLKFLSWVWSLWVSLQNATSLSLRSCATQPAIARSLPHCRAEVAYKAMTWSVISSSSSKPLASISP